MKMIVLPNGNAVRSDTIVAVIYLEASYPYKIGSMDIIGHPDRVRVDGDGRVCELIEFPDRDSAVSFRDELIKRINDSEENY